MIILDTNVVSEVMRPRPDRNVLTWVDNQVVGEVFLTAVTAAELYYGVARLPDGRRKEVLTTKVIELIEDDFADSVLPFTEDAALYYADIVASREDQGQPISMADAQIAAICRRHRIALATRNGRDFAGTGIDLVDPWTAPVGPAPR